MDVEDAEEPAVEDAAAAATDGVGAADDVSAAAGAAGVDPKFRKFQNVTWDPISRCWKVSLRNTAVGLPPSYTKFFGTTAEELELAAQHRDYKIREWGLRRPMNFPRAGEEPANLKPMKAKGGAAGAAGAS